jgi:hypothetical protein
VLHLEAIDPFAQIAEARIVVLWTPWLPADIQLPFPQSFVVHID